MGTIYASITWINGSDIEMARRHLIGEEEVRQTSVEMLVDTGSYMMCINESIREQLGLPFIERRRHFLADDQMVEHDIVGPLCVKFQNRTAICSAAVLEGNSKPLLGAIPIEEMDVLIDAKRQELVINPEHPDGAQHRIPTLRRVPGYLKVE